MQAGQARGRVRRSRGCVLLAVLALVLAALATGVRAEPGTWIFVDSRERTVSVIQGFTTVQVFYDAAFGRGGTASFRLEGDGTTPTGIFYVSWINPKSRYHLFFGLDYPAPSQAEEALRRRLIDRGTYEAISAARLRGEVPPQDTPLGGHIGIHGVGDFDPEDHRLFDWTLGCVALTDRQVEELARWVDIGTMVVIQ